MKSLFLAAVLMIISTSSSFAKSGAKSTQTNTDGIRMIREFK